MISRPALQQWLILYRLGLALLLFTGLFFFLSPAYRFILDDDGVAYATITRRWATGDYFGAINGLWSPLHSWLAVPFYKAGFDLLAAFRLTNFLIGAGLLWLTHLFLNRAGLPRYLQLPLLLTTLPFLLYTAFCQLAADNLFCLLFLLYVYLCHGIARATPWRIVAIAVVAAFAYLAKAYAFPLFLLHFTGWRLWTFYRSTAANKRQQLALHLALGIGLFLLLCAPWVVALYHKYGFWGIGYAGQLNLHLDLVPFTPLPDGLVVPPPWPDSPTVWEDPYFTQHGRWAEFSWVNALPRLPKQLLHNLLLFVQQSNQLSFLSLGLLAALALYVAKKKDGWFLLLFFSAVLLPSGYSILHLEERFLWPLFFLLLTAGSVLLHRLFIAQRFPRLVQGAAWLCFAGSFVLMPLNQLQDMHGQHQQWHTLAQTLRQKEVTGKVLANEATGMRQVAFHSGSQFYESTATYFLPQAVALTRRFDIDFYYLFYHDSLTLSFLQQFPLYQTAVRRIAIPEHRLVVLQLKPSAKPPANASSQKPVPQSGGR